MDHKYRIGFEEPIRGELVVDDVGPLTALLDRRCGYRLFVWFDSELSAMIPSKRNPVQAIRYSPSLRATRFVR